ncbi:2-keto-4-pentenoate hydratase [Microbacterium sp. RD1]|uniref:2-keto-4-pentenoate hydratase n=1 Tax=Microbacterium sp. RD1 TaxID=3457313 RepID=UPI003FA5F8C2
MPTARTQRIDAAARRLADAESQRADLARLTDQWESLDTETAYEVQARGIALRAAVGHPRIGIKLGLTSPAKQRQMSVDAPIVGVLTADMRLAGQDVPLDTLIHAKAEPEIAFVLGRDLVGPGVTAEDARAGVARVHGAIEIIDSRFRDYLFRLPDVIADNASSALFVLTTDGVAPDEVSVVSETVDLLVDGEVVDSATGAAVMGDPYAALAFAANDLAGRGDRLRAGDVVLSGGMTDAKTIAKDGRIEARFAHLGTVAVRGV